jgi:hypothetical protein
MSSQATRLESWYIMHIQRNTMANSFNHCWKWNATKHFTHILEINFAVSVIIILNDEQQRFNSKIIRAPTIQITKVFKEKCPLFYSAFNQIPIFSTDYHKSPRIQSHGNQYFESRDDTCEQTEGHDEIHTCFSQIHERAWSTPTFNPPSPFLRQTAPQQMSFSERIGAIYSITYLSLHVLNSNILQSKTIYPSSVLTLMYFCLLVQAIRANTLTILWGCT